MQGSKLRAALLKCEPLAWHSCLFCWAVPAFTGPFFEWACARSASDNDL